MAAVPHITDFLLRDLKSRRGLLTLEAHYKVICVKTQHIFPFFGAVGLACAGAAPVLAPVSTSLLLESTPIQRQLVIFRAIQRGVVACAWQQHKHVWYQG